MVRPAATRPTIVPTVTRRPRMHGLPPITSGSNVILVRGVMAKAPVIHCRTGRDAKVTRHTNLAMVWRSLLMLPSSSAGPAIAAGYGVDLKTMFWQGAKLTALLWALLVVAGYLLARFWPAFGSA